MFPIFCYIPVNLIETDENYVYCLVEPSSIFFMFWLS